MDNQTTPAGVAIESTKLFGSPLAEVKDADQLREMADKLWSLLDDIDTASDQFKPTNEAGYRRFYEYAMKKADARRAILTSDGYDLYLPNAGAVRPAVAGTHQPLVGDSE